MKQTINNKTELHFDANPEPKKLQELIDEYSANGYGYQDDGNGSAFAGQILDYDENAKEQYAEVELRKLVAPVTLEDGSEMCYASEWIEDDNRNAPFRADNPYRYRLFF